MVINAIKDEQIENCRFWKVEDSHDLPNLIRKMYSELKIGSILVEGGRDLLQQFLDSDLWDEIYRCTSQNALQEGVSAPNLPINLTSAGSITWGNDRVNYFLR